MKGQVIDGTSGVVFDEFCSWSLHGGCRDVDCEALMMRLAAQLLIGMAAGWIAVTLLINFYFY